MAVPRIPYGIFQSHRRSPSHETSGCALPVGLGVSDNVV